MNKVETFLGECFWVVRYLIMLRCISLYNDKFETYNKPISEADMWWYFEYLEEKGLLSFPTKEFYWYFEDKPKFRFDNILNKEREIENYVSLYNILPWFTFECKKEYDKAEKWISNDIRLLSIKDQDIKVLKVVIERSKEMNDSTIQIDDDCFFESSSLNINPYFTLIRLEGKKLIRIEDIVKIGSTISFSIKVKKGIDKKFDLMQKKAADEILQFNDIEVNKTKGLISINNKDIIFESTNIIKIWDYYSWLWIIIALIRGGEFIGREWLGKKAFEESRHLKNRVKPPKNYRTYAKNAVSSANKILEKSIYWIWNSESRLSSKSSSISSS